MKLFTTLSTLLLLAHASAWAGPSFTYEAQLIKPDGTPVSGTTAQIKIQVRTPDAASCLLYEEQQVKNLSTTNGYFNFRVNDGTGTRLDSSGYSFDQIFSNNNSFYIPSANCVSGSGTVTSTPLPQDGRTIKITFKDETMGTWEEFPTESLGHVPYALQASAVGGFPTSSLLRVESSGTPGSAAPLTPQNFTDLTDLLAGTSTKYMSNSASGATVPSFASTPGGLTAGKFWYDSTSNELKYYNGSITQTLSAGGGGITSINGLTASTQSLSTGNSGVTPSWSSAGGLHTLNIPFASSTSVTAGLISKSDYDNFNSKLSPSLSAGQMYVGNISNVATPVYMSGDATLSNTGVLTLASSVALLPGRAGGQTFNGGNSFSENLTLDSTSNASKGNVLINPYDGDVGVGLTTPNSKLDVAGAITSRPYGASTGQTGQLILKELGMNGMNSITMRAPDSLAVDTYITLPANSGSNGQVLMTDGSGNTSWGIPASPSTILASPGSASTPSITFNSDSNTGLYNAAADMLGFSTSGTERMRIDNSGNIGIGTNAPIAPFHLMPSGSYAGAIITAQTGTTAELLLTGPSGSSYPGVGMLYNVGSQYLEFTRVTNGSVSPFPWVRMNGGTGVYSFASITGSTNEVKMSLQRSNNASATTTGTPLARITFDGYHNASGYSYSAAAVQGIAAENFTTTANGAHLLFYTTQNGGNSPTERIRITDNGNVGIGTATPAYKLDVFGDINMNTSNAMRIGGTSVCTIAGCNTVSDRRFKQDIEPLANSLDKILQIQGVEYNWIDKEKFGSQHQVGLIAQDLEKIYPEVVKTDAKSGFKSVSYDNLIAPVIEAIKEIFWRSEEQNRKIASIEAENEKLKRENMSIKSYLCAKDPAAQICN